jgi:hypothetical protein
MFPPHFCFSFNNLCWASFFSAAAPAQELPVFRGLFMLTSPE